MALDKFLSADERKRIREEAERDFGYWLRQNNPELARSFADEKTKSGFLSVGAIRSIVCSEILQAHWPKRGYKLRVINVFSGEPYHMEEYRSLVDVVRSQNRFAGI